MANLPLIAKGRYQWKSQEQERMEKRNEKVTPKSRFLNKCSANPVIIYSKSAWLERVYSLD